MTHRDLFIDKIVAGGSNGLPIILPDDPTTKEDMPAFLKGKDLGEYCEDTTEDVRKVIEEVYRLMIPKIRQRYNI
jgi:hypothetical protein